MEKTIAIDTQNKIVYFESGMVLAHILDGIKKLDVDCSYFTLRPHSGTIELGSPAEITMNNPIEFSLPHFDGFEPGEHISYGFTQAAKPKEIRFPKP